MLYDCLENFDKMLVDKIIPFSVIWELTHRCNQKCVHCYQYLPDNNELSFNKIKDILLQLEEKGCLYLTFTGGEPLLREDFWRISEFARQRNFAIDLFTNGTMVDRQTAKRIADLNFASVHITVLGSTEQVHDRICQRKGSFQEVTRAVDYLKEEGVRLVLKTPLIKENFSEMEELKKLEQKSFVHAHVMSPLIFPKNDGGCAPLSLRLNDCQIKEYYESCYEKFSVLAQELEKENRCTYLCYYGKTFCCINPKGEVYPCVAAPLIAGDLKKESFKDIWDNSSLFKYLRETGIEDLPDCKDCSYKKTCYRCGGLAYMEGRGFRGKSLEACRLAKIHAQVREKITTTNEH